MNRKNIILLMLATLVSAGMLVSYCAAEDDDEPDRIGGRELRRRPHRDERIRQRGGDREDRERERHEDEMRELRRREQMREYGRMRDRMPPPPPGDFNPEAAEHMERMLHMLDRMRDVCFDPASAAMVAIGGLKNEIPRKPEAAIRDLEAQLEKTRTLGLRNAIRLSLKDLYKATGQEEKVFAHLRAMIAENDQAIEGPSGRPRRRGPRAAQEPAKRETRGAGRGLLQRSPVVR